MQLAGMQAPINSEADALLCFTGLLDRLQATLDAVCAGKYINEAKGDKRLHVPPRFGEMFDSFWTEVSRHKQYMDLCSCMFCKFLFVSAYTSLVDIVAELSS